MLSTFKVVVQVATVTRAIEIRVDGVRGKVRVQPSVVCGSTATSGSVARADRFEPFGGDVMWDILPVTSWRNTNTDGHVQLTQLRGVVVRDEDTWSLVHWHRQGLYFALCSPQRTAAL